MSWLVTGANGQLGMAFRRALTAGGAYFADRATCDLGDPAALAACLGREQPSIIINCAAYTAVDAAENDEPAAMRVNAEAVGEIAGWAARHDALMVHFSTDYVFDGTASGTYAEDAPVNPLSAYGRSKQAGEALFMESGVRGMCLPPPGSFNDGANFLLTMTRLMQERDHLRVVDDQRGVPTTTDFLADITLSLIGLCQRNDAEMPRLIHAVPGGETSWFGFASHIRDMLASQRPERKLAEIEPIPSSEFPQVAKRPSNSVMANDLLQSCLGRRTGKWEDWHNKLHGR